MHPGFEQQPGEDLSVMVAHIIGAVVAAIIMLAGLYSILRNVVLFLNDQLRGHPGKWWVDRPYFFRAVAWTATLFWLYGPTFAATALGFNENQLRIGVFALYMLAAASFLWVLRVSFINSIPATIKPIRTRQAGIISWNGIALSTYLVQLVFAAGIGAIFAFADGTNQAWWMLVLGRLAVLVLLVGSALASLWRTSYIAGPEPHTFRQRMDHVIGGTEGGHPAANGTGTAPAATEKASADGTIVAGAPATESASSDASAS
jgi:hypothetical protein